MNDHRKCQLPLLKVAPQALAHHVLAPFQIQEVILHLECHTNSFAKSTERRYGIFWSTGETRAQFATRADEHRSLATHNLKVRAFIKRQVFTVTELHQFTLTQRVGDFTKT